DDGLAGWTVYLDLNEDGQLDEDEPTATTNASGEYALSAPGPGTYVVREVIQPGWRISYPCGTSHISLTPDVVASIHDEPKDGIGDSFNSTDGLLRQIDPGHDSTPKEDRAIVEIDASSLAGASLSEATVAFTLWINNHGGGERRFHVWAYEGNGSAELEDFSRPGVLVGDVLLTATGTTFTLEAGSAIQSLLDDGANYVGLRFDPIGGYVFPVIVRDVSLTVLKAMNAHTVTVGAPDEIIFDFEHLAHNGE
ncbi:unnamed protein product, partial [marine sediment metagenome]